MIQGMLWFMGIYGISMISVHIAHLLLQNKQSNPDRRGLSDSNHLKPEQYALSHNNHLKLEQYALSHNNHLKLEQYALSPQKAVSSQHYVLVSNQNQLQIEWYIRSLLFFSWLKGITLKITLIDEGSTDETLEIVDKLSLQYDADIHVLQAAESDTEYTKLLSSDQVILIKLNNHEDLQKIPLSP